MSILTDRLVVLRDTAPDKATRDIFADLVFVAFEQDIQARKFERALDDIVADCMEDAHLPTYSCIPKRETRPTCEVLPLFPVSSLRIPGRVRVIAIGDRT
jgi:hypothetical protein